MRAASDGGGDPLGDRPFPQQFVDYYRLAARNASAVTQGVVAQIADLTTTRKGRKTCQLLARAKWTGAAKRIRGA